MLSKGIEKLSISDGTEVQVEKKVSVSLSNEFEFFRFLEDRKEADIVKLNMKFDKMDTDTLVELYQYLSEKEISFEDKRSVHAATLKKYFKDLLGINQKDQEQGIADGKYLRPQDVEAFAKPYIYHTTKVKEKK